MNAEVREKMLAAKTSRFYHGWLHVAYNATVALGLAVWGLTRIEYLETHELLVIPLVIFCANHVEYGLHRFVMHRKRKAPPLQRLYRGHHEEHHHYFVPQAMASDKHRDFALILYPPVLGVWVLLVGIFAVPGSTLCRVLFSPDAGWLAFSCILVYFQFYEVLEFSYHTFEDSWVRRIPWMKRMYPHHRRHHQRMTRCNFNVTFPMCDWLYGTLEVAGAGCDEDPGK